MHPPVPYSFKKQIFWLSGQRSIFWEQEKALIVADLHLGKTGHFRKSGIPIPQTIFKEDMQRLVNEVQHFKPSQLIIVGDLFHSEANKELELFKKWRKDHSALHLHLVKGNHDILDADWYKKTKIQIHEEELIMKNFCFRHGHSEREPTDSSLYFFTGHLHPGISISGAGRQSLHFPCFYFKKDSAVLPAFSRFTGTYPIRPQKGETVYAIVESKLIQVA